MKYMGSKKSMLKNGLGELLLEEAPKANRVLDPFCGSASVVWFLAEKTDRQVIAGDLQKFSIDLANSILMRTERLSSAEIEVLESWLNISKSFYETIHIELGFEKTKEFVLRNRKYGQQSPFAITNAYAGYYFSFDQAIKIDSLLTFIPEAEPLRSLASAALIEAASQCVAAPGHTAQPFQPEGNGLKAIIEAWKRDPFHYVQKMLVELSSRYANKLGRAETGNAIALMNKLKEGDMVFLDPPYSGVHYSRFYHVLETISRNKWEDVSGKGRYPSSERRPKSEYSLRGKSISAFDQLLERISKSKASAIVTFPVDDCSNGMSGKVVKEISAKYFLVSHEIIKGRFSTMGGNNSNRPARHSSEELVLVLKPK